MGHFCDIFLSLGLLYFSSFVFWIKKTLSKPVIGSLIVTYMYPTVKSVVKIRLARPQSIKVKE